jgi:hypothetical protein
LLVVGGPQVAAARLGMKRTHLDYPVKGVVSISQAQDDISSSDVSRDGASSQFYETQM